MEQVAWRPVVGYEGLYEVSNDGQVRSLDMYVSCGHGAKRLKPGRMKTIVRNNRGYCCIMICHNGKTITRLLHRLVAEAFVPNTDNKPQVNHIDGNIENNSAVNLEWVSDNENKKHSDIKSGGTQRPKRPVIVTDTKTSEVLSFGGLREAERTLGLDHRSALNVVSGKQRHTKGYSICYAEGGGA